MDYCVFIQTNHKQYLGAKLAEYALRRNSAHADRFHVRIMQITDFPCFAQREGQPYLREGLHRIWNNDDLQSFTPLRFAPPELMGYQGRAVVIDPDVFAVRDIWDLLTRDMKKAAIMCRPRSGYKGRHGALASSVMLLDCTKLEHWNLDRDFNEMFEDKRDYMPWISLKLENRKSIELFENEWNDFDRLTPDTRMLHNTKRKTQPWKTGLPVDFRPAEGFKWFPPKGWINRARRGLFGEYGMLGQYKPHPDPEQEKFFFGLLRECLDSGAISEDFLRDEIRRNHLRHDAFDLLDRTPKLAA